MLPSPYLSSPEHEWATIVTSTPESCRQAVAAVVQQHGQELALHFYQAMLQHPMAATFLHHEVVRKRLQNSMELWIQQILAHPMPDPAVIVAHQRHVGEVHARIQLPIHLVARGGRVLKHALFARMAEKFDDANLHRIALFYAGHLIDLALELMSEAFLRNTQRGARTDEAYRLFSLGQNMSVERERQRSVLLEWGQDLLFALHRQPKAGELPRLATSEFGLWFRHKASTMFEGTSELEQIDEIIERVDTTLLPRLSDPAESLGSISGLVVLLQNELDHLRFQLANLFEKHLEVENGRDTLTRLLNRRFLPAALNREIALSKQQDKPFALMLMDLDHFKNINDAFGHDAGDLVLQQAATLVMDCVRNGDFVFRYGGEELLVMLVEVSPEIALRIAETLRQSFADHHFMIGQGRVARATVSVGVAHYDGHPDHQYLINRADQAMYEAKQQGRNRVCVAL